MSSILEKAQILRNVMYMGQKIQILQNVLHVGENKISYYTDQTDINIQVLSVIC